MKQLTVFTPTFNRAFCLHLCYESLCRQTCQDFTWLIIDDGSTDRTREMVSEWIEASKIDIQYHYQKNQGMHGAHNTAYEKIKTELNVCIDSDDYMADDAIEKILSFWAQHGSNQVSGVVALNADISGKCIGTALPTHRRTSTLFDLYYKYGVTGDKKLIYRTDCTTKYPYPTFPHEKYVGLAYKYYLLDMKYELLIMNETVCHVEYLSDGSSHNMLYQYVRNPQGFSFYRKALMNLPFTNNLFKFRQAIHYVSSSILSRNLSFIKETPYKLLTILAVPFGIVLNIYIKMKTRPT